MTPVQQRTQRWASLPTRLVDIDQWVCWRKAEHDGKSTKIPVTPGTGGFASSTDPETWTDFETALEYSQGEKADGLGFVFSADDPFVGIDLDDCRDPETSSIDEDARDIVNQLDSYTEISPSGTGFHVLIEGELPEGGNRHRSVEMYDSARFFTMTGDRVDVKPQTVNERQEALDEVHREYIQEPSMGGGRTEEPSGHSVTTPTGVDLSNEALIKRAHNAANGEKFERLWEGDTTGYPSHSEADMALCCLLAFWTRWEHQRIDHLFRQSGLMRPKWDTIHYADNTTYGDRTIERAIENTSDYYEPSSGSENTSREAAD